MNSIRYKGELYVESVVIHTHKRCAKGTHWNIIKKKCVKLTPQQLDAIKRISKLSTKAYNLTRKAKTRKDHKQASEAHDNMASRHWNLAEDLKNKGFPNLAKKHNKLSKQHNENYKAHKWRSEGYPASFNLPIPGKNK